MIEIPLIISVDGDLSLFSSVEKAEQYLEVHDIASMSGFDSQGRRLVFSARTEKKKYFWGGADIQGITISVVDNQLCMDELRKLMISYLRRLKNVNRQEFVQRDWDKLDTSELLSVFSEVSPA